MLVHDNSGYANTPWYYVLSLMHKVTVYWKVTPCSLVAQSEERTVSMFILLERFVTTNGKCLQVSMASDTIRRQPSQ